MALSEAAIGRGSTEQGLQLLIHSRRGDFNDLGCHDIFGNKRVLVHPGQKLRSRRVGCEQAASLRGLDASRQQEDAVIEAAVEPALVPLQETTGL